MKTSRSSISTTPGKYMEIDQEILSLNPDELEVDEKTRALIRKVLALLEQVLKENAGLREENQRKDDVIRRLTGGSKMPKLSPNRTTNTSKNKEGWTDPPKKEWDKDSKLQNIKINRTEKVSVDGKKLQKDAVSKGFIGP